MHQDFAGTPDGLPAWPRATIPLIVNTPGPRWHYGFETPIVGMQPDTQLLLVLRVRVTTGAIGLGTLNRDRTSFYHEVIVPAAAGEWQEITVPTWPGRDCGGLVVRNQSDDGHSVVEIFFIGARQFIPPLYLIYQPGKVASQSVEIALGRLVPPSLVRRHHLLSENAIRTSERNARAVGGSDHEYFHGGYGVLAQAAAARKTRAEVESLENRPIWVITGTREPISYSMAAFFQNLDLFLPGVTYSEDALESETARAIDRYLSGFERMLAGLNPRDAVERVLYEKFNHPGLWFDNEFNELTGADICAAPLSGDELAVFSHDRWNIIVYRSEKLRQVLPKLAETLGLCSLRFCEAENIGENKQYGAIYHRFKDNIKLTPSMISHLRNNRYTRRFYPDFSD